MAFTIFDCWDGISLLSKFVLAFGLGEGFELRLFSERGMMAAVEERGMYKYKI